MKLALSISLVILIVTAACGATIDDPLLVKQIGSDSEHDNPYATDARHSPYVGDMRWVQEYDLFSCKDKKVEVNSSRLEYLDDGCDQIPDTVIGVIPDEFVKSGKLSVNLNVQRDQISNWNLGYLSYNDFEISIGSKIVSLFVFGLNHVDPLQECMEYYCGAYIAPGITAEKPTETFFRTPNDVLVMVRANNGTVFPFSLMGASKMTGDRCFHDHLVTNDRPTDLPSALQRLKKACGSA